MKVTVRELIGIFKGELVLGNPRAVGSRGVVDSRSVEKGDVFFALKGERTDGHHFALAAARSGAAAVVVSNLNWLKAHQDFSASVIQVENPAAALQQLGRHLRSEFKGLVIGITGSNGKTTTKEMVASLMRIRDPGLATKGNLNSQVGLPLMLSQLTGEEKWMVLEMGASEPGNIAQLAEVARPKIAVLTGIGQAHLKSFGSLERIASSKWELMDTLPFDGTAIVPWGVEILEPHIRSYGKPLVFFGDDPACPVRASAIELGPRVRFQLHLANDVAPVTLPVGGRFNVTNALAAAAVGWTLKRPLDEIVRALETFQPAPMRMEIISHDSGTVFINDAYNANPASMIQSIRSLVETYPGQKKILVLGSMLDLGPDSDRLHFHLGTELSKFALEKVYLFGSEMAQAKEGAVASGGAAGRIEHVSSLTDIADEVKTALGENVVVLVKGSRGMKMEAVIEHIFGTDVPSGRV